MNAPSAIIFDFNGVIIDDEAVHFALFREVAAEDGIELSEESYYANYCAFDDRDAFTAIYRDHGSDLADDRLQELIAKKASRYDAQLEGNMTLFPGVEQTIQELSFDFPLAVTSGALYDEIKAVLSLSGILDVFTSIVAAEDVQKGKPDPEGYQLAFSHLRGHHPELEDCGPGVCLVIEDTPAGIRAAKNAGMRVLAVTNTYPAEKLSEADWVRDGIEGLDADAIGELWSQS
jgi:HAD superfamily hydrolase (TIGR01509 family)